MRKSNIQSPAILAGTQTLENTTAAYGQASNGEQDESDQNNDVTSTKGGPPVKEDFLRSVSLSLQLMYLLTFLFTGLNPMIN